MPAPHRPPPPLVPAPPPKTPGRRRRGRRVREAAGAGLLALGAAGVVGAAVAARHPGVARLRALVSDGDRDEGGGVGGAARLACTPAVTVGAPGELRPVAALGNGERATGLFWWPPGRPGVAGERRAVRALASERGVRAVPVGRGGAFAVTADGATLRALVARAPGVSAQLAVAGTRELCLLD